MYSIAYHCQAQTVQEACRFLDENPGARPISGGTDLLVKLQHTPQEGTKYVRVNTIPALFGIYFNAVGDIVIGAAETFTNIWQNPIVCEHVQLLSEAAVSMGGPQIRNVATIGGNICNGAVSADSAASLFALDAKLSLSSTAGSRVVPIQEFYLGPGKVALAPGEILTHIVLPRFERKFEGSSYLKYSMREAMDIATLGTAAACTLNSDGSIRALQLAATVVAPTPIRFPACETAARGIFPTAENLRNVSSLCLENALARTSWRASKEFREHILAVYLMRAAQLAANRALNKGGEHHE